MSTTENMKISRYVATIMLFLCCQHAIALDGGTDYYTEVDGIYYRFNKEWHNAAVTCKASSWAAGGNPEISYNYTSANYSGDIVIPETVEYEGEIYEVTGIANGAFYHCTVESLTIPASITYIEPDQAWTSINNVYITSWEWWNNLSSHGIINLANHIYVGGTEYDMTNFKVPDGMSEIKDGAFKDFTQIKRFTLPSTTKIIGESAFENCSSLEEIILPDNVEKIGSGCFKGCTSVRRLYIGDGLETVPAKAFSENDMLEEISVGEKVTTIGYDAFTSKCVKKVIVNNLRAWCENLRTEDFSGDWWPEFQLYTDPETMLVNLTIPEGVKTIHEACFKNQQQLLSISFPSSLETIDNNAFDSCKGLKKVNIGEGVRNIGDYAFISCNNIEELDLGANVEKIGPGAFGSFSSSTDGVFIPTIIARMKAPYPINEDAFSEETYRKGTLYVPVGLKEVYSRFDGWRNFLSIKELEDDTSDISQLTIQDQEGEGLFFQMTVVQGGINVSVDGSHLLHGAIYAMDGTYLQQLVLATGSHFVPLAKDRTYIIKLGQRCLKAAVY